MIVIAAAANRPATNRSIQPGMLRFTLQKKVYKSKIGAPV